MADCVIRDRTQSGARLLVGDADAVPIEGQIYFDDDSKIALYRQAWKKNSEVGIQFLSEPCEVKDFTAKDLRALRGVYYALTDK